MNSPQFPPRFQAPVSQLLDSRAKLNPSFSGQYNLSGKENVESLIPSHILASQGQDNSVARIGVDSRMSPHLNRLGSGLNGNNPNDGFDIRMGQLEEDAPLSDSETSKRPRTQPFQPDVSLSKDSNGASHSLSASLGHGVSRSQ
ncbi:hypothetical protein V6N13_044458 [Hibiscus sabdariffa]